MCPVLSSRQLQVESSVTESYALVIAFEGSLSTALCFALVKVAAAIVSTPENPEKPRRDVWNPRQVKVRKQKLIRGMEHVGKIAGVSSVKVNEGKDNARNAS